MLHRSNRSAALLWFWRRAQFIAILSMPFAATAGADDLRIQYDEIESLVNSNSPLVEAVEQKLEAFHSERDAALRWTNPRLAFGLEDSDLASEWDATIGKRFTRPFSQKSLRKGWRDRTSAAELFGIQERRSLVSATKSDYLHLKLLDEHMAHLSRLMDMVEQSASAAASRYDEGQLSGNANELIQLTAYSIRSSHRELMGRRSALEADWRARMGMEIHQSVEMVTVVGFQPVQLGSSDEYMEVLGEQPLLTASRLEADGLGHLSTAFKPTLIPEIELYGGYKSFGADVTGFVAGVSIDLPILDRGAWESRQYEAERRILESELALMRLSASGEVEQLASQINRAMPPLEEFTSKLGEDSGLAKSLLSAYREGTMSLDSYLNAVQIFTSSLSTYYKDLMSYYTNVLRLETLTGDDILVLDD